MFWAFPLKKAGGLSIPIRHCGARQSAENNASETRNAGISISIPNANFRK